MAGLGVGFLIGYSLSAAGMVFRSTRAGEMEPKPLGYFIAGTSIWIAYALYRYSQGLKPTEFAAPAYLPYEEEDPDPDMATPILDKVMDIEMMMARAQMDSIKEQIRMEMLLKYMEEHGPIVNQSKKKKKPKKPLKGFEASQGFPYQPGLKTGMQPAKNEWYSVVGYTGTSYANEQVLEDHVALMTALSTFKAACDSRQFFTVEMYRHRTFRAPGHHELHFKMPKEQKTLVLKCKYDYITGNDTDFLKFVKGSFDPKWKFQAEGGTATQCQGTTKAGNPCRAPAEYVWPNGFCQHHGPNANVPSAPLMVQQPDSSKPTVVLENRDMFYEELSNAGGRQRDRLMEQPEYDDDDSAYDEWAKENVAPQIDSPENVPPWANAAYESLYGTKWWDIGWVRDGEHPVEDGPEVYEDSWRDDLPWYWGEMTEEEAKFIEKNPILDATKPRTPKKLTIASKELIESLGDIGTDDVE